MLVLTCQEWTLWCSSQGMFCFWLYQINGQFWHRRFVVVGVDKVDRVGTSLNLIVDASCPLQAPLTRKRIEKLRPDQKSSTQESAFMTVHLFQQLLQKRIGPGKSEFAGSLIWKLPLWVLLSIVVPNRYRSLDFVASDKAFSESGSFQVWTSIDDANRQILDCQRSWDYVTLSYYLYHAEAELLWWPSIRSLSFFACTCGVDLNVWQVEVLGADRNTVIFQAESPLPKFLTVGIPKATSGLVVGRMLAKASGGHGKDWECWLGHWEAHELHERLLAQQYKVSCSMAKIPAFKMMLRRPYLMGLKWLKCCWWKELKNPKNSWHMRLPGVFSTYKAMVWHSFKCLWQTAVCLWLGTRLC